MLGIVFGFLEKYILGIGDIMINKIDRFLFLRSLRYSEIREGIVRK